MSTSNSSWSSALGDPALRRDLAHTIRRRIDRVEVDDVVQATLVEALSSKAQPTAAEDVRRFVFAIARQKIADVYRRREREARRVLPDREPEHPASDLGRWVDRILPTEPRARRTFEWMLREADGETLAEIAATERVSPAMVRQRVSRLRRWLRTRWAKESTGLAAFAVLVLAFAVAFFRGSFVARQDRRIGPDTSAPSAVPQNPAPIEMEPRKPAELIPKELREPRPPRRRTPPPAAPSLPPPAAPSPNEAKVTMSRMIKSGVRSETTRWTTSFKGIDLAVCWFGSSPRGNSHLSLKFSSDGALESARVDSGPLVGRPEAGCVERLFAGVRSGLLVEGVTGDLYFTLGPSTPPAPLPTWLEAFERSSEPATP